LFDLQTAFELLGGAMTKNEWWERYNSYDLCIYHADKFDEWWDAEKYNWEGYAGATLEYISSKFSDTQLKQLLLHNKLNTRNFAAKELERRENDKEDLV